MAREEYFKFARAQEFVPQNRTQFSVIPSINIFLVKRILPIRRNCSRCILRLIDDADSVGGLAIVVDGGGDFVFQLGFSYISPYTAQLSVNTPDVIDGDNGILKRSPLCRQELQVEHHFPIERAVHFYQNFFCYSY